MENDTDTDLDAPVEMWPSDVPKPLTVAEQRDMYEKVCELHAAFVYIRDNGPTFVEQLAASNPMLKMLLGSMTNRG